MFLLGVFRGGEQRQPEAQGEETGRLRPPQDAAHARLGGSLRLLVLVLLVCACSFVLLFYAFSI